MMEVGMGWEWWWQRVVMTDQDAGGSGGEGVDGDESYSS